MPHIKILESRTRHYGDVHYNPIDLEMFCLADEARQWAERFVIHSTIILLYPCAGIVCLPDAKCYAVYQHGIDFPAHVGLMAAAA